MLAAPDSASYFIGQNLQRFAVFFEESIIPKFCCSKKKKNLNFAIIFFLFLIPVLQKAGTHMEFTFLASYIVMLLGFLIMENSDYEQQVRKFLRENNFSIMVELLKKFFNFMNLTASVFYLF